MCDTRKPCGCERPPRDLSSHCCWRGKQTGDFGPRGLFPPPLPWAPWGGHTLATHSARRKTDMPLSYTFPARRLGGGSLRYGGITYRYSQGPFRAIMFMAPDNRMHLSKRTFDSIALQLLSNVLHSYFNRRCRHLPPLPRRAPLPFDVHSDTLDGKTIVWPFSDTIFLGCGGCDGERVGHRPDKHGCVIAPPIVAASLPVPRHSWHSGAQLPTTFPPAVSLSFVAKAELSSRALTEIFLPPRPIMLRLSR